MFPLADRVVANTLRQRMTEVASYLLVLLVVLCLCVTGEVAGDPRQICFQPLANTTTSCVLCPVPPHIRMLYCSREDIFIHPSFVATTTTSAKSNRYSIEIGEVIFGLDRSRGLQQCSVYRRKMPPKVSELNGFFCNESQRQGRLCSQCMDGCGISLYTYYGLPCSCPCNSYGIPLYFLLEIGFSTLFFAVVFVFKISVLSSKWYGLLFYFQTTANIGTTYPVMYTLYGKGGHSLPIVLDSLHGIWNLDFLRLALPQFCVSQSIGTLGAISTGYISGLWPLFLVILVSLAVELHKRNYKIVVYPWLAVNKMSAGVIQRRFAETNLMKIFVTFIVVSYMKLIYVSFALLGVTIPHTLTPENSSHREGPWLSLDPDIHYGSLKHLKYAVPASFVILFLGFLLPLALLLYPMICVHRLCGERMTGRFWISVKTFIEAFHGGFKDGTNGTRDYRALPGLTLLWKMFLAMTYAFRGVPSLAYNLPLIYVGIAGYGLIHAAFFGLTKPYKIRRHNLIDVLLYALLAVECICISALFMGVYEPGMLHTIFVLAFLPVTAVVISVKIEIFKFLIARRTQ